MKILTETPNIRLLCDGKKHMGEDKRNGNRYFVQKCDCKAAKMPAAEIASVRPSLRP